MVRVGEFEGVAVGLQVGVQLGLGLMVGVQVGDCELVRVGEFEGVAVGLQVGVGLRVRVGVAVGVPQFCVKVKSSPQAVLITESDPKTRRMWSIPASQVAEPEPTVTQYWVQTVGAML